MEQSGFQPNTLLFLFSFLFAYCLGPHFSLLNNCARTATATKLNLMHTWDRVLNNWMMDASLTLSLHDNRLVKSK